MFNKIIIFTACLILISATFLKAQNPAPGGKQQSTVLIMNAKAHLGNGKVIENAAIAFENGKLTLVADATTIRIDKRKYDKIVDATGKHVYPGFIACNTTLGLVEIELVRSTLDFREVGEMNSNVRSIIAYNTDSRIIPTVRSNGVLLAQIVPQGGIISGQSSVVNLDAWNWEDATYKMDVGVHVNWPRMYVNRSNNPDAEEKARLRMKNELNELENFFNEASAYLRSASPAEKNLRFESMRSVFDGTGKLFVHCNFAKEIVSAVDFSKRFKLKMVLVGGNDAWRVSTLLKENSIPVIINGSHSLPPREDEDVDIAYKLPYLLKQAGVDFAMTVDGSWQVRNLMFQAGTTQAYGLTAEEALASITSSPAGILGIDSSVGTLEEGKDATLFISAGDALDMRSNQVISAYINGREVNLTNAQKELNTKYLQKYGLE
ncbi:MAG: amidohydrolase family protein [Bacteroidia bacterium]|nr:amidohydrolase family protein [Bacteroidia bacterium]